MKRIISAALAALMLTGAFVACGEKDASVPVTTVATTSAEADVYAEWLTERLGYAPKDVVLGIGSDSDYTIDMTDFEDDGYILRTVGETTLIFGKTEDGLDRAVRAYAKAVEGGYDNTLNETFHEGYRVKRLTIAGRDISEYTVYYPEDANKNMTFAASELVRLVEIATGVKLPIVVGTPASPAIELRHSDDPSLRDEGYSYTVTEDGLLIEGAVDRGCMYGVWRFLQHELDWEGLATVDSKPQLLSDAYLNESDHIDIPVGTEKSETPFMDCYEVWTASGLTFDADAKKPSGSQFSYGPIMVACHGMQNNKFCDNDYSKSQICYTDENRYIECAINVEKYIDAKLASGKIIGYDFKDVDIAQGDIPFFCYCPECVDVHDEEGHTNSGAVVRFANRLAEEMDEKYPGLYYKIFAYLGTNEPPKVTKPNHNVIVSFCYDTNCSNHLLDGSQCTETPSMKNGKTNRDYDEWLRGWCEITDIVYVWHYNLDTGLQQYTVIDTIYDDYRYFRDLGIDGVFTQFDHFNLGFKRFELQLAYEMNWNPDMTREEYEELFCSMLRRYYGDGWEFVREYVDYLSYAQNRTNCFQCWDWNSPGMYDERYDTNYYMGKFDEFVILLDEAMYRANSIEQEEHAEILTCSMLYMGCYSSYYLEYLKGNTERIEVLSERYDLCLERLKKYGFKLPWIHTISKTGYGYNISLNLYDAAWKDWVEWFYNITGKPLPEDAPVIK